MNIPIVYFILRKKRTIFKNKIERIEEAHKNDRKRIYENVSRLF